MTSHKVSSGKTTRTHRSASRSLQTNFMIGAGPVGGQRKHRAVARAQPGDVVWPSGEGREIGTIRGTIDELLGVLRRRVNRGRVREHVSYGEDGAESAVVLGPPSRTLACLLSDDSQAPGVVAVIADVGADPCVVVKTVERVLGRRFEVHRHAV